MSTGVETYECISSLFVDFTFNLLSYNFLGVNFFVQVV